MSARPLPDHGSRARYARGCRCDACRAGNRQYEKTRVRRVARGTWQPYVDAEPSRRHVRELMDRGVGWRRVAEVSGVSHGTISKLLYGVPDRALAPLQRVRPRTAEQLLAVRFSNDLLADGALMDATGTWRRIQALVAVGWPKVHIARALGATGQGLQLSERLVVASTARSVADLYDRWWDADPTAHGVQAAQADRARRYASVRGWPPPMAWDDDALDVPEAQPHSDSGERDLKTLSSERFEDVAHLLSFGVALDEAAARVGLSADYVRQRLRTSRPGLGDSA